MPFAVLMGAVMGESVFVAPSPVDILGDHFADGFVAGVFAAIGLAAAWKYIKNFKELRDQLR